MEAITPINAVYVITSGVILSLTIIIVYYFREKQGKVNTTVVTTLSTFISILVLLPLFRNKAIFISIMMFYLAGLVAVIFLSKIKRESGIIKSISLGWKLSKKFIYLLAIGGFIVSLSMSFATLEQRQEQFKTSVMNFTQEQVGEIEVEKIIEEERFIEEPEIDGEMEQISKEEFREHVFLPIIIEGREDTMNRTQWEELNEEEKERRLNQSYQAHLRQQGEMDEEIEEIASEILEQQMPEIEKEVTEDVIERMFVQVPVFRAMLASLPFITALVVSSFILLYGTLIISPLCSIASILIPKETEKENKEDENN